MRNRYLPVVLALAFPATGMAEAPESLHGYAVSDPFRHLETDEGAAQWIDRQEAQTSAYFDGLGGDAAAMAKRLDELSRIGGVSGLKIRKARTFYVKRTGDQEQGVLYLRDGSKERKLVDPAALDASGKVALDWYYPSPSGKLVAYGLSRDGSEESVLHLLKVDDGKALADEIPNTRHSSIAWLPDESGFYYTRYPEGDRYNRRAFFHRIGDEPSKDAYVFGKELGKTDWTSLDITDDGATVFLSVSKGWSVSELWTMDRASGKLTKVLGAELGALFGSPKQIDGRIVLLTNHEAPRFKLVSVDPASSAPASWKTIVPEGDWPLDQMKYVAGKLAMVRLVKAVAHLELYEKDGKKLQDVALPDIGSIGSFEGEANGDRLAFTYASFVRPATAFEMKLSNKKVVELASVVAPKIDGVVVEQVEYPSYDGTRVPMFVVHRKDVKLDGSNPTLLTGYGGFNVSYEPGFSPSALYWVERGASSRSPTSAAARSSASRGTTRAGWRTSTRSSATSSTRCGTSSASATPAPRASRSRAARTAACSWAR
ncbi:Prolyl endopeptidase [Vulgatibacter incomptus]|uniref:Prolyl endopeptidase n=1 Tax=Vulgatibacter incomptus TaxID=1391653 RepID=A0A0K1PI83_9BACT|nr:Prolyl endopeptidase [Vulgatibacter incomptus]